MYSYCRGHNGKRHADYEHDGSDPTVVSRQALRQRWKHTHAHQRGQQRRRHQRRYEAHLVRNEILAETKIRRCKNKSYNKRDNFILPKWKIAFAENVGNKRQLHRESKNKYHITYIVIPKIFQKISKAIQMSDIKCWPPVNEISCNKWQHW